MPASNPTAGYDLSHYLDPSPVSKYMPENATQNYAALLTQLQGLINALVVHPASQRACRAAPPNSPPPLEEQNKVFFIWDFCSRSRHMLLQIDPELKGKEDQEVFKDVVGRCFFTEILINDTTGKLAMMTGERPGQNIDFGDEVREASKNIGKLPNEAAVPNV